MHFGWQAVLKMWGKLGSTIGVFVDSPQPFGCCALVGKPAIGQGLPLSNAYATLHVSILIYTVSGQRRPLQHWVMVKFNMFKMYFEVISCCGASLDVLGISVAKSRLICRGL